jgi:hypothetical protein
MNYTLAFENVNADTHKKEIIFSERQKTDEIIDPIHTIHPTNSDAISVSQ